MLNDFQQALSKGLQLAPLFDQLDDVYLFVKNREGVFMRANRSFVTMMGLKEESEIIGKSDRDVFAPHLAEEYRKEDTRVMDTGVRRKSIASSSAQDSFEAVRLSGAQ